MAHGKIEFLESSTDSGQSRLTDLPSGTEVDNWCDWLERLMSVQQDTLSSKAFFQSAVEAVVELVGLDGAAIYRPVNRTWKIVAHSYSNERELPQLQQTLMDQVANEHRGLFQAELEPQDLDSQFASVIVPVFRSLDEFDGVLVGFKELNAETQGIQRIQAVAVQLIANMVSGCLVRESREAEATRFEMQLSQFASPSLVKAMAENPNIFEPTEREITVLFCDIGGFTSLTERVGAEKTFSMISNLLNQLTGCILDEEGFIMSYMGDGIAAMWNAPADQPDHAELACWAAINMQKVMSKLSQFWNFITGESLNARIGIATGDAHVGNAGSRWRLNYSALGPYVNLASRLEGANKFFGSSILIAESTKERLFSRLDLRRIGPVSVKGMKQAIQVFEVLLEDSSRDPEYLNDYAELLALFEKEDFYTALGAVDDMLAIWGESEPALSRLKQEVLYCLHNQGEVQPEIRLTQK